MNAFIGDAEWQTVFLFAGVAIVAVCAFIIWQQRTGAPWTEFHIVGLFADKVDGNWQIVQSKFQSFGSFVISSIGVVVCVIRGTVPPEFVALLTLYCGVYVLNRLGTQQLNTRADVDIRKAEINRGRREDVDPEQTVEEQEPSPAYTGKERRKKRLLE